MASPGVASIGLPTVKRVFVPSWTANGAPVILGVEPNGNHRVLLDGRQGYAVIGGPFRRPTGATPPWK